MPKICCAFCDSFLQKQTSPYLSILSCSIKPPPEPGHESLPEYFKSLRQLCQAFSYHFRRHFRCVSGCAWNKNNIYCGVLDWDCGVRCWICMGWQSIQLRSECVQCASCTLLTSHCTSLSYIAFHSCGLYSFNSTFIEIKYSENQQHF